MEKIPDYDKVEARTGEFETIEAGGYIAKIIKAEEQVSKSGNKMLVFYIDIAEGNHKDYFKKRYEEAKKTNNDAKWLPQGIYRQLTEGNSLPYFKGIITSIEKSNEGYKWDWNEESLKGKLIGVIYGEEEYRKQDGKIGVTSRIQWIRSTDNIIEKKYTIPERRQLIEETNNIEDNYEATNDLPF